VGEPITINGLKQSGGVKLLYFLENLNLNSVYSTGLLSGYGQEKKEAGETSFIACPNNSCSLLKLAAACFIFTSLGMELRNNALAETNWARPNSELQFSDAKQSASELLAYFIRPCAG